MTKPNGQRNSSVRHPNQKVPPDDELRKMADEGLTVPEMIEVIPRRYGTDPTEQALRRRLGKAGIAVMPARANHRRLFGERQLAPTAKNDPLLRYLKLDNRVRHPGKEQAPTPESDLDDLAKFREWMEGDNKAGVPLVIELTPAGTLRPRPRREGESSYIAY